MKTLPLTFGEIWSGEQCRLVLNRENDEMRVRMIEIAGGFFLLMVASFTLSAAAESEPGKDHGENTGIAQGIHHQPHLPEIFYDGDVYDPDCVAKAESEGMSALKAGCEVVQAQTDTHAAHPEQFTDWSFTGPFGRFDQASLQRGYKIYREVCASCHGMKQLAFRNLGQKGGPFYHPDYPDPVENPYVKAIAAEFLIEDIDIDTGEVIERPGIPSDPFPQPYPNPIAAKAANNGKAPPDLSVMVKARHDGANYVRALMQGYDFAPPQNLEPDPGNFFNPYYPGWVIAMAPQLPEDRVEFDDGTPATTAQMAKDVTQFLQWAAEPEMEQRKAIGFGVLIYLLIFTILLWLTYKAIWRGVKH